MLKQYVKARAIEAQLEIEDLLLSKEVWLALIGILIAVAKWQSWDIPTDVFATVEIFILAVIFVFTKKK